MIKANDARDLFLINRISNILTVIFISKAFAFYSSLNKLIPVIVLYMFNIIVPYLTC